MNTYQIIGDNIRKIRKEKGLSQEELSELTNISKGTISQMENGNNRFNLESLEMIANVLGVQLYRLVPNTGNLMKNLSKIVELQYDNEIDELLKYEEINEKIVIQRLFYPDYKSLNTYYNHYEIKTLFEFILYLPLMNADLVEDFMMRVQGSFWQEEEYVLNQIKFLYSDIPDDDAKKYADKVKEQLNYEYYEKYHLFNSDGYYGDAPEPIYTEREHKAYLDKIKKYNYANKFLYKLKNELK